MGDDNKPDDSKEPAKATVRDDDNKHVDSKEPAKVIVSDDDKPELTKNTNTDTGSSKVNKQWDPKDDAWGMEAICLGPNDPPPTTTVKGILLATPHHVNVNITLFSSHHTYG